MHQPETAVLLSSGNPTEKWNAQAINQSITQDHTTTILATKMEVNIMSKKYGNAFLITIVLVHECYPIKSMFIFRNLQNNYIIFVLNHYFSFFTENIDNIPAFECIQTNVVPIHFTKRKYTCYCILVLISVTGESGWKIIRRVCRGST